MQCCGKDPLGGAGATVGPARKPFHWWPIAIFAVICLAANVLSIWCIRLAAPVHAATAGHILSGIALGQWAWLALIAAWTGRSLAGGLATATIAGVAALAGFALSSDLFITTDWGSSALWAVFLVPLYLSAGAGPFCAARYAIGWHVVAPGGISTTVRLRVGDLFWILAIVAAGFAIAEVSHTIWQMPRVAFVRRILMLGPLAAVALATLFALPVGACALLAGRSRTATGMLIAMPPILIVIASSGSAMFGGGFEGTPLTATFRSEMLRCGVAGGVGSLVLILGCWALRASGYRLVCRTAGVGPTNRAAAEHGSSQGETDRGGEQHRRHRRWEIAIVVSGIAAGLFNAGMAMRRARFESACYRLANTLAEQGGGLQTEGYRVTWLKLPPGSTDQDLARCEHLSELESLDLSQTKVTAAGLRVLAEAPLLKRLNLSDTRLDGSAVAELIRLRGLYHLSLAGTEMSSSDLQRLIRALDLAELDISRTKLSAAELRAVLPVNFGLLRLRGLGLTDADLAQWENFSFLARSLDLGDNLIRGPGLAGLVYCEDLYLDGNPLTDDEFGPVVQQLNCMHVVLSDTPLTDGVLPFIASNRAISWIDFGRGQITDDGLIAVPLRCNVLGLHGPQFRGKFLRGEPTNLFCLDFSYSGMDGASAESLRHLRSVYRLSLRGCDIGDAALEHVTHLDTLREIDLADTGITAAGLVRSDLSTDVTVYLDWDQFEYEDLLRIRKRFTVRMGRSLNIR